MNTKKITTYDQNVTLAQADQLVSKYRNIVEAQNKLSQCIRENNQHGINLFKKEVDKLTKEYQTFRATLGTLVYNW